VNGVRPSADVTLQSLAGAWAERVLAVVMTGIGVDGREGARAVRAAGGRVICQDAASSLIDGMPRAVSDAGLADAVLPLDRFAAAITDWCEPG
jgi:two-component system chemotaxis response regulator CheB